MGALKQQLIRIGYFDEYETNERQRIADIEAAYQQQEEEDALRTDFENGLPLSEDAPPEMYWPAVLVQESQINNCLLAERIAI